MNTRHSSFQSFAISPDPPFTFLESHCVCVRGREMASKKAEEQGSAHGRGLPETGAEERGRFEYFGCVYHLGVNSIGREYSHLRFLCIHGKYVEMYKRDPHENPGIKPIKRGVVGHTLMVKELGRRKLSRCDYYVLRFYNRLDETKKGEVLILQDSVEEKDDEITRLKQELQQRSIMEEEKTEVAFDKKDGDIDGGMLCPEAETERNCQTIMCGTSIVVLKNGII